MLRSRTAFISLLALGMTACNGSQADSEENSQAVKDLIQKTKDNMILVEGGSFQMGDFGPIDPNLTGSDKGLPYSADEDNKPLHKVTLDTFYMSPTKVTYADYDVFTAATDREKINNTSKVEMQFRHPNVPAGVNWQQARDYCSWLAAETSLPFALPTEAQWEYAARSGGKFIAYGTNTGTLEKGKSIPTTNEVAKTTNAGDFSNLAPYPVDMYPPNPLGLYQMSDNGYEWVSDWYQADYYQSSPEKNPKGPKNGKEKVVRGLPHGDGQGGALTIERYRADPKLESKNTPITFSFRCTSNSKDIEK
ncbi:formylglycine-generating enzyme family protein [Larsenimonas rhizosphaerae]|uniref:SUMF1/EgtB/PvdO family nonheme iron enzyme n=1 Tax=Larsenimonas rhizosphaerae TaxID=2944682 RepID=A0AA41ZF57_9GAMM|nr:SUMF1/EgtB/PvdO family nonheme iron enzyme [Larsenimonas rhizosphaerae]MCM2130782.1 formylglycine-generating enzyme family protein [Larsenimonas rhizosphaerae]MCX2523486.1 SUMF1/EgtB/PvdO family nonheme iron enzyme [Larsenimonas rhizosphaerae]